MTRETTTEDDVYRKIVRPPTRSTPVVARERQVLQALAAVIATALLAGCIGDGGRLGADQQPTAAGTPRATNHTIDVAGSVLLGACAMKIPALPSDGACNTINGNNVLINIPIEENMTSSSLQLEWDAASEQSERLAFTVGAFECVSEDCERRVFFWDAGTSPLKWHTKNLTEDAPAGWTLFAYMHFDPAISDPVWIGAGGFGQEFRITGQIARAPLG